MNSEVGRQGGAHTRAGRALGVGDIQRFQLPLRCGDSDSLNHVNNTLYFRLMEEARMQILYSAGMKLPDDHGFILAHASCDFLRPLTYPAQVQVTHAVTRIGRSSLEFEITLDKVGDEEGAYARGRNVLVWMDYVNNRSQPWPAEVLGRLGGVFTPAG